MKLIDAALILLTVIALSAGQVLFKLASRTIDGGDWRSFVSPYLLIALVVYGGATLLWVLVLTRMPLQQAYPFIGLAFVIVPLVAHRFLGEPLYANTFVGAALIMLGIWISVAFRWKA